MEDSIDFDGIFQEFPFVQAIHNVLGAVVDGLNKRKLRKRPQKRSEFPIFHSLERTA
jgi:hypothetical protein